MAAVATRAARTRAATRSPRALPRRRIPAPMPARPPSVTLDHEIVRLLAIGWRVPVHSHAPALIVAATSKIDEPTALLEALKASSKLLAFQAQRTDLRRRGQ